MTAGEKLPPVALLFFDRYNAEDPLFVADVARRIAAAAKNRFRVLVVHASDDAVERVEEAQLHTRTDPEETGNLVERAVRLTNQSITRRLIDEGVAAVSIQGCDRGLLKMDSVDGLTTGNTEWLERTIRMGGVPVVSLLAQTADRRAVPAEPGPTLDVLTRALSEYWSVTTVYFTTNQKSSLYEDGAPLATVTTDRLASFEELPFPVRSGVVPAHASSVVVTNSAGLRPEGSVTGTIISRGQDQRNR